MCGGRKTGETSVNEKQVSKPALTFATAGGPQKIQCWNTEGIFRLIQSGNFKQLAARKPKKLKNAGD